MKLNKRKSSIMGYFQVLALSLGLFGLFILAINFKHARYSYASQVVADDGNSIASKLESSAQVPDSNYISTNDESPAFIDDTDDISTDKAEDKSQFETVTAPKAPQTSTKQDNLKQVLSLKCQKLCNCELQGVGETLKCKNEDQKNSGANNYPNHVCPQNFRNLADAVYMWEESSEVHFNARKLQDVADCLDDGAIIYVLGRRIDDFFKKIYPKLKNKFVLITGKWVASMPTNKHRKYVQKDRKIIHWFAQNGENIGDDIRERFTQIPVGLNCFEQSRSVDTAIKELAGKSNVIIPDIKYDKNKMLLLNFDATTDKSGGRKEAWNHFCGKTSSDRSLYEYTGCMSKAHGVKQYLNSLSDIYKRNLEYRFWLSPRGNGVDCHRTYEAMYFGRIPIMLSSAIDALFDNLPVMIVDKWSDVTLGSLTKFWEKYEQKKKANEYDYEKLTIEYWRAKILAKSRHSAAIEDGDSLREPRCWSI